MKDKHTKSHHKLSLVSPTLPVISYVLNTRAATITQDLYAKGLGFFPLPTLLKVTQFGTRTDSDLAQPL